VCGWGILTQKDGGFGYVVVLLLLRFVISRFPSFFSLSTPLEQKDEESSSSSSPLCGRSLTDIPEFKR
jgi:hypothetical protein